MASILNRSPADDAELARRVSAGDSTAFTMLDERHRAALLRYAGSLLRRSEHDAEDVVQDVLVRAHEVLRASDAPDELRPGCFASRATGRSTRSGASAGATRACRPATASPLTRARTPRPC